MYQMLAYMMEHIWLLVILISVLDISVKADVFMNQFAVHISGGHNAANRVAREAGMINKGQVSSLLFI